MKQRLAIAASLLRPRELIILDEPTNGLGPQGTREVRAGPADRRRRRGQGVHHPRPGRYPGRTEASAALGDAEPERVCAGIGVRGFLVPAPSLEDLFARLTGEGVGG
jgi:hypothetical protein